LFVQAICVAGPSTPQTNPADSKLLFTRERVQQNWSHVQHRGYQKDHPRAIQRLPKGPPTCNAEATGRTTHVQHRSYRQDQLPLLRWYHRGNSVLCCNVNEGRSLVLLTLIISGVIKSATASSSRGDSRPMGVSIDSPSFRAAGASSTSETKNFSNAMSKL
jgi:hypothetical protein